MPWQQLKLRIAASELARAEALLGLAGASAIAIHDAGDAPIHEPLPGTTPLWPELDIEALFDASQDLAALAALLEPLTTTGTRIEALDADAVERGLRQIVHALEIGPRLKLAPADDPADERTLRLHMGLAFGTGQHPTTRLCLEWLERHGAAGQEVLDFGCGSGVLALAALKFGAKRATAIDIEPQALEASRANARLNGFEDSIRIGGPELLGPDAYALILANVLAEPLIALAPEFAAHQPPGGQLVLSGLLPSQQDVVVEAYANWYEAFERHESDGWALLTGRRRSGYDR